jgi:hypothetical protein
LLGRSLDFSGFPEFENFLWHCLSVETFPSLLPRVYSEILPL